MSETVSQNFSTLWKKHLILTECQTIKGTKDGVYAEALVKELWFYSNYTNLFF